jgi:hypothetical protein
MIVLMLTILVDVVIAIEKTRALSIELASGGESGSTIWSILPGLLGFAAAFFSFAGIVGYGLLYALRKTGMQRLSNIHHHASDRN